MYNLLNYNLYLILVFFVFPIINVITYRSFITSKYHNMKYKRVYDTIYIFKHYTNSKDIDKYEVVNLHDHDINQINVLVSKFQLKASKLAFMILCLTFNSNFIYPVYSIDKVNKIDNVKISSEKTSAEFVTQLENNKELNTDEFIITFNDLHLGLKLIENYYQGFPIVTIKEIINPELTILHPQLKEGVIITQINNQKVDGISLKNIIDIIKSSIIRPINIKFRDPNLFFQQLDSTEGPPRRIIRTSYLPANARFYK